MYFNFVSFDLFQITLLVLIARLLWKLKCFQKKSSINNLLKMVIFFFFQKNMNTCLLICLFWLIFITLFKKYKIFGSSFFFDGFLNAKGVPSSVFFFVKKKQSFKQCLLTMILNYQFMLRSCCQQIIPRTLPHFPVHAWDWLVQVQERSIWKHDTSEVHE